MRVLLVTAAVGTACSSSDGDDGAPSPPSCRLPEDLSRTAVLFDPVYELGRTLVTVDLDARTVTVVCEGLGGAADFPKPPLAAAGVPYPQLQEPELADAGWSAVSPNLAAAVAGDDLVDLRTGERVSVGAGSGWGLAYPTGTGGAVMVRRSAHRTPAATEPSSWCLLAPGGTEPDRDCGPVPGAAGPGMPVVAADGAVGWAPVEGAALRAGPITAGTVTGALGRWVMAQAVPPERGTPLERSLWVDEAGTSALVNPTDINGVLDDDALPVSWLTDVVVGPDGASGRYVQSDTGYGAVVSAIGDVTRVPLIAGFATDGPDSVVLAVRDAPGASLVRVRAGSDRPEVVWDGGVESERLPFARVLWFPPGSDDAER